MNTTLSEYSSPTVGSSKVWLSIVQLCNCAIGGFRAAIQLSSVPHLPIVYALYVLKKNKKRKEEKLDTIGGCSEVRSWMEGSNLPIEQLSNWAIESGSRVHTLIGGRKMINVKRNRDDLFVIEVNRNFLSMRAYNVARQYADHFEEDDSRMCQFVFVEKEEMIVVVNIILGDI